MNANLPERIAIIGPGLLGGSLLMALRALPGPHHLRVWARREESAAHVVRAGWADFGSSDLDLVVEGAQLVILCTPVASMPGLVEKLRQAPVGEGCVVTDVGSVKAGVVSSHEEILSGSALEFVGSHPMAGSERAGIEAARASLFQGSVCLMTPTLFTTDRALSLVRQLWQAVGCRVLEMHAEEHDRKVARVSHLPHLAAAAVTLAALHEEPGAAECVGNGFRDTTRVSAGDPALWTGIVLENRAEVLHALRSAQDRFGELLAMLENMDEIGLHRFLAEAKKLRDAVSSGA